ncbi:phosphatase [Paraglaciecola Antarctic GD virus 1]|nr:phosphatase [Paraglaciecola Antarctic GD virus 1]
MAEHKKPTIVTDVDGVLLSWQSNLPYFLKDHGFSTSHIGRNIRDEIFLSPKEIFVDEHGASPSLDDCIALIEEYNRSDYIRTLPAYNDALAVINVLKYYYDFVAVSALCDTEVSRANRKYNLDCLFPNAFSSIHISGMHQSKKAIFKDVIKEIGQDKIACYVDDLTIHLKSFNEAWREQTFDNSWYSRSTGKAFTGEPPTPITFHMTRRLDVMYNEEPVASYKAKTWYQIMEELHV